MDAVPERWTDRFDDRERKQIAFCTEYKQRFNHGAPGHLDMLVIAKLAGCLVDAQTALHALERQHAASSAGDEMSI